MKVDVDHAVPPLMLMVKADEVALRYMSVLAFYFGLRGRTHSWTICHLPSRQ